MLRALPFHRAIYAPYPHPNWSENMDKTKEEEIWQSSGFLSHSFDIMRLKLFSLNRIDRRELM